MENVKNVSIFETTSVDLAAFLMFEGIKYLESRIEKTLGKEIVVMRFLDDRQNARDLERVFMNSDLKRYRDIVKYLLKEVHIKLRER